MSSDFWIDQWLGSPRFQRSVDSAGGDRGDALALYEWNASLSAALLKDFSHFEVALRNAYDKAISSAWKNSTHWLLDPQSPVVVPLWRVKTHSGGLKRGSDINEKNRRQVFRAIDNCGKKNAEAGKVIAELTFGFWRYMTTSAHEKSLWVTYLHKAFSGKPQRSDIDRIIGTVHILRNRIAHQEQIFNLAHEFDPAIVHTEMMTILERINPEAKARVLASSSVAEVLNSRP